MLGLNVKVTDLWGANCKLVDGGAVAITGDLWATVHDDLVVDLVSVNMNFPGEECISIKVNQVDTKTTLYMTVRQAEKLVKDIETTLMANAMGDRS